MGGFPCCSMLLLSLTIYHIDIADRANQFLVPEDLCVFNFNSALPVTPWTLKRLEKF